MKRHATIGFFLLVLSSGCSGKDPVSSFKDTVNRDKGAIQAKFQGFNREITGDFTFDVQKTDSLVSPYVGYVSFPANQKVTEPEGSFVFLCKAKLSYAFQDNAWVPKGGELTIEGGRVISVADEENRSVLNGMISQVVGRKINADTKY